MSPKSINATFSSAAARPATCLPLQDPVKASSQPSLDTAEKTANLVDTSGTVPVLHVTCGSASTEQSVHTTSLEPETASLPMAVISLPSSDKVNNPVDTDITTAVINLEHDGPNIVEEVEPPTETTTVTQDDQTPLRPPVHLLLGSASAINQRAYMEDRLLAADLSDQPEMCGVNRAALLAVFDGHSGADAAEMLQATVMPTLLRQPELTMTPLVALGSAVESSEAHLLAGLRTNGSGAGSTALLALLTDNTLHLANVGDCRAVLGGAGNAARALTRDHKPTCPIELQRILSDDADATVSDDGYLYGDLGVARALGNPAHKANAKWAALSAVPELVSVELGPDNDVLVLASDGLWDVIGNAEAITTARRSLAANHDCDVAARALLERAQKKGSNDNICVVVALLTEKPAVVASNSMLFRRRQTVDVDGGAFRDSGSIAGTMATPVVAC